MYINPLVFFRYFTKLTDVAIHHNPGVAGSIPIEHKLFPEYILFFTMKKYKNARSGNFV